jgi:hypothetical protein
VNRYEDVFGILIDIYKRVAMMDGVNSLQENFERPTVWLIWVAGF